MRLFFLGLTAACAPASADVFGRDAGQCWTKQPDTEGKNYKRRCLMDPGTRDECPLSSCHVRIGGNGQTGDRNCGSPCIGKDCDDSDKNPDYGKILDKSPDDGYVCFAACECSDKRPCSITWTNWSRAMLEPPVYPLHPEPQGATPPPADAGFQQWDRAGAGLRVQFSSAALRQKKKGTCFKLIVTQVNNLMGYVAGDGVKDIATGFIDPKAATQGCGATPRQYTTERPPEYPGWPQNTNKQWRGFNHSGVWDHTYNRSATHNHCEGEVCNLNLLEQTYRAQWITLKPMIPHQEFNTSANITHNDTRYDANITFIIRKCEEPPEESADGLWLTVGLDMFALVTAFSSVTLVWFAARKCREWKKRRSDGDGGGGSGGDLGASLLDPTSTVVDADAAGELDECGITKFTAGVHFTPYDSKGEASFEDIVIKRWEVKLWREAFFEMYPLTWLYHVVMTVPDSRIVDVAGTRAIKYLAFQRNMVQLLMAMTFIFAPILLLTNYHGSECATKPSTDNILCKLSSKNISKENGLLYIHMLLTLFFSVATYAFSKRYVLGRTAANSQFLRFFAPTKSEFGQSLSTLRDTVTRSSSRSPPPRSGYEDLAGGIAPTAAAAADGLLLSDRVRGGRGQEGADAVLGTASTTAAVGDGSNSALPPARLSNDMVKEWGRETGIGTFAIPASRQDRMGLAPLHRTPAHTLMIRRVSTQGEMMRPEDKAWLVSSLKKIFHRGPWHIVDVAIFRSSRPKLLKKACGRRREESNQCTAFITFKSSTTPADIIRQHQKDTRSGGCYRLFWCLAECFSWVTFLFPKLRCCPASMFAKRKDHTPQFGFSREAEMLRWKQWQLHPGPAREDILWGQLNVGDIWFERETGRCSFCWVPRLLHQRQLRSVVLGFLLFILGSFLIFPLGVIGEVLNSNAVKQLTNNADVKINVNINQTDFCPTDGSTVALNDGNGDCPWRPMPVWGGDEIDTCQFIGKYIPSFLALLINVIILPFFIDIIAIFGEMHYLHSDKYRSILRKNLMVLLVTTLLVPSLALSSSSQIWDVISNELALLHSLVHSAGAAMCPALECQSTKSDSEIDNALKQNEYIWALHEIMMFPIQILTEGFGGNFLQSGAYFYNYTIHITLLGLAGAILLIPKKVYEFASCCTCVLTRGAIGQDEKALVWEFPLEYNYSVVCAMFAITLTYSIAHPPILVFGLGYAVSKLVADKHALLFGHEGNLDAHFVDSDTLGKYRERGTTTESYHHESMDRTVHNCLLATIAIFQLAMYGFLYEKASSARYWLVVIILVTSVVFLRRLCRKQQAKARLSQSEGDEGDSSPMTPQDSTTAAAAADGGRAPEASPQQFAVADELKAGFQPLSAVNYYGEKAPGGKVALQRTLSSGLEGVLPNQTYGGSE